MTCEAAAIPTGPDPLEGDGWTFGASRRLRVTLLRAGYQSLTDGVVVSRGRQAARSAEPPVNTEGSA